MSELAHCYRVVGTLIPIHETVPTTDPCFVAGAPIAVDLVVCSTDRRFASHTAAWHITLGYTAWRWQTPPTITRLEEA